MRRSVVRLLPLTCLAVAVASLPMTAADAAGSLSVSGSFAQQFGAPGQARVQPLGHAAESTDNNFSALTLVFPAGTLVMNVGQGAPTTPGGSGVAPGGARSAGNPVTFAATYTVDSASSTGEFQGATGVLTGSLSFAGVAVTGDLHGQLYLS